jgi:hypothetical protein
MVVVSSTTAHSSSSSAAAAYPCRYLGGSSNGINDNNEYISSVYPAEYCCQAHCMMMTDDGNDDDGDVVL